MYSITEDQLNHFTAIGTSKSIGVAMTAAIFGAFVSVLTVLLTMNDIETISPVRHASLIAVTVALGVLLMGFGIKTMWDIKRSDREIRLFKEPAGH